MKIFYILSIILFISVHGKSQTRSNPQDPAVRITRFYPNPAVSQITFDFDQAADKNNSFQVFNFIGKKVYESQNVSAKTVIDVTDYYRGVYIFRLEDKNGKLLDTGKFQVTH
jgi:hypothetical protein